MSFTPSVRRLTGEDLNLVLHFDVRVFPAADQWNEQTWHEELTRSDRLYLGAFAGAQLIGMAGAYVNEHSDLLTIGTHPQWRGRSVASLLLDLLLDSLGKINLSERAGEQTLPGGIEKPIRRVRKILLEVRASNEKAIKLYASRGFEIIGEIARYYHRPTEDAVIMERRITPAK
ncbi:MAG: GNAT family N-acetyltransferase [Actinomycetaceae bacterium]|nr:GNAT family N-acetyltransferase [Actinomycetaceae bacterium]